MDYKYDVQVYNKHNAWLDLEMCDNTQDIQVAKVTRDRLQKDYPDDRFRIIHIEIKVTPIYDSDLIEMGFGDVIDE